MFNIISQFFIGKVYINNKYIFEFLVKKLIIPREEINLFQKLKSVYINVNLSGHVCVI